MPIKFLQKKAKVTQISICCNQISPKKKQNWNKLSLNLCPRQTTFGICVQRTCLGSMNSLIQKYQNTLNRVLPWRQNFEKSKNCTYFSYVHKYINLRFIKVILLMLKKQQKSM